MGQYSGAASPAATNGRIRDLLAAGQRGFSVALDLPTQNGLDSDHPLADGEVGKVGMPIDTVDDMCALLDGIAARQRPPDPHDRQRDRPARRRPLRRRRRGAGHSPDTLRVMLQNDVLKEYFARGTYIFPPARRARFTVDVVEYCARAPALGADRVLRLPRPRHGGTAVDELGIATADGIVYRRGAAPRPRHRRRSRTRLYLFLSADLDVLEEAAKFRAARRMWARLIRKHYGARPRQLGREDLRATRSAGPRRRSR